jgi:hypothetical protein
MKLEELAGALTELKERLFISIKEESAAEANETLLKELRQRIMEKQQKIIKKKVAPKPVAKPADKKLNEQQSKFLKTVPGEETPEEPQQKSASPDSIQLQKTGNGYMIGIDSGLPEQIKNLAQATDSDIQQYLDTINENTKKQLDQLL